MLIHDEAAATSRDRTPEGFLRVRARIARAGLHLYRAGELGPPEGFRAEDTIRVYRPPGEVFDPVSMASFAGKPVTDDHPPEMVDARNWKRFAIGQSGPAVSRDGDHLAADLLITDAGAVARAENGAQLSNGYHADFEFTPGITPEGETYDAVQTRIRGNHIALVDAGRCGATCRIGDAAATCRCADPAPALTTVAIDGLTIETTAAGAEAIDRLKRTIEAKDGAIAALEARVLDAAAIDTLVSDRMAAIEGARSVLGAPFDPAGRSTAEIRRAVVAKLVGDPAKGRSDSYVAAAFDTLLAVRTASNPLAAHLAIPITDGAGSRDAARRDRDRFLNQAWKGEPSHGAM